MMESPNFGLGLVDMGGRYNGDFDYTLNNETIPATDRRYGTIATVFNELGMRFHHRRDPTQNCYDLPPHLTPVVPVPQQTPALSYVNPPPKRTDESWLARLQFWR
jgi:hypothetical protein